MTQDTHLTVVFLHQVNAGQPFYCTPAETRAWIRLPPAGDVFGHTLEVPVRRGRLSMHMNGMVQVWVRPDDAHR